MRRESLEFLKELVTTPSPSGFESPVQEICAEYARPFAEDIYKDVHGNQYHVRNAAAELRVMLAGHVDEIGLMVNDIDDKGFLGFVAIGGIDASVLDGQRVVVHGKKGPVAGVIGRTAIHLTEQEERGKPLKLHQLWVDIGARNKNDAAKVVAIGDPVTIDAGFVPLRNECVAARGFDDRIGAFVVLETLRLLAKRKPQCAVFGVTTVQEEIGLRGAVTSSYGCRPHVGVAVDVGHAVDHPQVDARRYREGKIGDGPILYRGPNINAVVGRQLVDVAQKHKIPHQMAAAPRATGTDANVMQLSRNGVATGLVSVPNRYMHSPVELICLRDAEHAAQLLAEWICTLRPGMSFIP